MIFRIILLGLFTLSSFSIQANERVSREALARAVFESFIPVIYFLSGSEDFKENLTDEEQQQFSSLGHKLIQRYVKLGPASQPGDGNTSNKVSFKLRFSSRNEDFILKEGEPPRTAKVTEDVWFNLNILNDPKNSFDFLGVFQLMFHEFGHKIEESKKNQDAIDRVAAKIKDFLLPFYKSQQLQTNLDVMTFILPYLTLGEGSPIDFQAEPVVLFRTGVGFTQTHFRMQHYLVPTAGYHQSGAPVQAYSRILLRPRFQAQSDQLEVQFNFSTQHYLIHAPVGFNYLPLLSNPSSVVSQFAVEPLSQSETFQLTLPLSELNQGKIELTPNKSWISNYYTLNRGRWIENLKVTSQNSHRYTVEGTIFYSGLVSELSLTAQSGDSEFEFPASFQSLGENIYKIKFELSSIAPETTTLQFRTLNINATEKWEMPELISLDLEKRRMNPLKFEWIGVGTSQGWTDIRQLGTDVNTEDVRMMFKLRSESQLKHLEISWIVFEQVYSESNVLSAVRSRIVREILAPSHLIQSVENGLLTFSFQSQKMQQDYSRSGKSGYRVKDTRSRAVFRMTMVTESLQQINIGTRMAPEMSEWRSMFTLPEVTPKNSSIPAVNVHLRTQCTSLL